MPKEVWILTLCQVLFTAAISIDLTITSLAGQSLTLHPELATIPFALLTVGCALIMPILGWQIRYHGRRNALITGCYIGVAGALISTISTLIPHFWGLCLGCLLVGAFQASAQFYRLAAGDLVRQELKQFAVSLVLAGGSDCCLSRAGPGGMERISLPLFTFYRFLSGSEYSDTGLSTTVSLFL
ncbi:MFS transporter [Erwinia aphidicola]|nr:MFS transporter [Erwinia aphidicola]